MKHIKLIICGIICSFVLCSCMGILPAHQENMTVLYSINGETVSVYESEKESYLQSGYYESYREVLSELKENLSVESIEFLGENHNRLCDFTKEDITNSDFASKWVFYRFTGINGQQSENRIVWKESVIENEYKLFFGTEIPRITNNHITEYKDGIYYIDVSDPGEIYGELENIKVSDDCVELIYQLKSPENGRDFNSKAVYKIIPADNENGFVVISKQTEKIDETKFGTEYLEEDKETVEIAENNIIEVKKLNKFPSVFGREYIFSNGAGGWATEVDVNRDGTFTGTHHDSDMGCSGDGYDATEYECNFRGAFRIIGKIDEYSYCVKIKELVADRTEKEQWIEDRVLHIVSFPYGIYEGEYFILYTPETPLNMLDEEFLSWWPLRFSDEKKAQSTLSCYGIYNVNTGQGLFAFE